MKREMKLIYEAPLAEELRLALEGVVCESTGDSPIPDMDPDPTPGDYI